MVKIYCIEDCNGLKYVGSTIQPLNERLSHHKCKKCSSRELNLDDCKIYTLEECDEENRNVKEQYWIDHTECVNERNTIFNQKDYSKNYNKYWYLKQKETNYYKQKKEYRNSWGGDPRYNNNNLLKINLDIFL